jgi:putative oxidoreductase
MTDIYKMIVARFENVPYSVVALLGRISIGLVFWNSGRTKVEGWDIFHVDENTLQLFIDEYKLPFIPPYIAALMAQMSEHIFSVLIIVGLATRVSALALLSMTLVIEIFVYPDAYVLHGTWAFILLVLIKNGAGHLSIDRAIQQNFKNL